MSGMDGDRFREVQPVPALWRRWAFIGAAVALVGLGAVLAFDPFGNAGEAVGTTLGFAAGIVVCCLAAAAKLVVEVTDHTVEVRWWILLRRSIARDEIVTARAVTYEPMREFGGWGIRFGRNGSRAYSMSGDRGVELILANGKRIVLGSLEPDRLVAALGR